MKSSKSSPIFYMLNGAVCLAFMMGIGACSLPNAPSDPLFISLKTVGSTSGVEADRLPVFKDTDYICLFQGTGEIANVLAPDRYSWSDKIKSIKMTENDVAIILISSSSQNFYLYRRPVPLGFSYEGCVKKSSVIISKETNEWVLKRTSSLA